MTKKITQSKYKSGQFGLIFPQFKGKGKEAIKFLLQMQEGECPDALYREDIGYIDIVWGDEKGGLKHIIEKHGHEIEQIGFKVEDFIPIVVRFGDFNESKSDESKKIFERNGFRFVISLNYKGRKKQWLLTAFAIIKKTGRKPRKL
jgi:hypothetical protein